MVLGAVIPMLTSCGASGAHRVSRSSSSSSAPAVAGAHQPADPQICDVSHGRFFIGHLVSHELGQQRFRIYLPPGYDGTTRRRYPVLYLLHGSSADETQWEDVGIGQGSDCLLAAHRMRPMLIVLLDAEGAEHLSDGAEVVERFVVNEVVPTIDRRFPTLADREHRAIGGISLGGGWSLRTAADHRDRFAIVGGHSPSTTLTDRQRTSLTEPGMRVWLDVGSNDRLRPRVTGLGRTLQARHADVSVHVWAGIHDRRYWSHHVQDYLKYYSARW
jgi:enterochelin esterase family protein